MVSDWVVASIGLIGALAGSAVTGYVNHRTTRLQQDVQNRRKAAEPYMDKKVELLIELSSGLTRCENVFRRHEGFLLSNPHDPFPDEDVEEAWRAADELVSVVNELKIFYPSDHDILTSSQEVVLYILEVHAESDQGNHPYEYIKGLYHFHPNIDTDTPRAQGISNALGVARQNIRNEVQPSMEVLETN